MKHSISAIYLNQFLRGLAFSLFGIFVPIYLLTLNYPLKEVFIYFLIFHFVTLLSSPIALKLSKHFGYKKVMISSGFFVVIFLILLRYLEIFDISVFTLAIIFGIAENLYFMPLNAFFSRLSEKSKRGAQVSNYSSLGQFAGLITPLIGALIITLFGFKLLFSFSIFLVLLSFVPLLKLKNIKPNTKITVSGVWRLTKKNKKYFIGEIADSVKGETEGIIWPIFIFLALKTAFSVGSIAFLVGAGTIIFTLFVGRFFDKKDKYFLMKLGGALYAAVWITRIFIEQPSSFYAISFAAGFFAIMISIPFNAIFYNKTEEHKDPDEFVLFREIPTFIGRAIMWIFMILSISNFKAAFVLAALASLFFTFFRFESKEKSRRRA